MRTLGLRVRERRGVGTVRGGPLWGAVDVKRCRRWNEWAGC